MSDKKAVLLAKKKELLKEYQYSESRKTEVHANCSVELKNNDDSDSDSDTWIKLDTGPTLTQVKKQQEGLKNCLLATKELCDIVILQSEVNVLVDPPVLDDEPEVTEPGTWREVTAECSVDHLVMFIISFFAHDPDRKFAPASYRGLQLQIVKAKHELELSQSVLPKLRIPSDAVEVIRTYATAFRSRRDTLSGLIDQFGTDIVMEAKPDGGYLITCPNMMQISWTLLNEFSPIGPFQHKIRFDIEYMEKEYAESIRRLYRQLVEPDVDTSERTTLLAQVIGICLRIRAETLELHESMSSDPEGPNHLERLRTTLDKEPEVSGPQIKTKSGLMAPPKTVPKRTKAKVAKNTDVNGTAGKAVKRAAQDGGDQNGGKRPKIGENQTQDFHKTTDNAQEIAKIVQTIEKRQETTTVVNNTKNDVAKTKNMSGNVATEKKSSKEVANKKKSIASAKNKDKDLTEKTGTTIKNKAKDKDTITKYNDPQNTDGPNKNVENSHEIENNIGKAKKSAINTESAGRLRNNNATSAATTKNTTQNSVKVKETLKNVVSKLTDEKIKKVLQGKVVKKVLNTEKVKKVIPKTANNNKPSQEKNYKVISEPAIERPSISGYNAKKSVESTKKVVEPTKKVVGATKKTVDPPKNTVNVNKKVVEPSKKGVDTTKKAVDPTKKVAPAKKLTDVPKMVVTLNSTFTTEKSNVTTFATEKDLPSSTPINVATVQNKTNVGKVANQVLPTKKPISDPNRVKSAIVKSKNTVTNKIIPLKSMNKPSSGSTKFAIAKISKTGYTEKENKTKIPQKQLKPLPETAKKHPLRISPRKGISRPGASKPQTSGAKIVKPVSSTNIPRLVKPRAT